MKKIKEFLNRIKELTNRRKILIIIALIVLDGAMFWVNEKFISPKFIKIILYITCIFITLIMGCYLTNSFEKNENKKPELGYVYTTCLISWIIIYRLSILMGSWEINN